jgi:MFS family permease
MVFTFITSSSTSIGYSILGDINPPEMRTNIFSLVNFSMIIGRSIGIAVCGVMYDTLGIKYSTLFLVWQIVFMVGLTTCLIVPKKAVPNELVEKRTVSVVIEKEEKTNSINDVVNMLLENQKKLAITLRNITKKQFYLTKLMYYSLEVINKTLNNPDPNNSHDKDQDSIESIDSIEITI